jgi:hypothetical protein
MFHQHLNVIRAFINYETSIDEDVQVVQKEINLRKQDLKRKFEQQIQDLKRKFEQQIKEVNQKIDCIENSIDTISVEQMYHRVTAELPFGKFKGCRVCDVAITNLSYLNWFFKITNVSFDKLFERSKTDEVIIPVKIIRTNDNCPTIPLK